MKYELHSPKNKANDSLMAMAHDHMQLFRQHLHALSVENGEEKWSENTIGLTEHTILNIVGIAAQVFIHNIKKDIDPAKLEEVKNDLQGLLNNILDYVKSSYHTILENEFYTFVKNLTDIKVDL